MFVNSNPWKCAIKCIIHSRCIHKSHFSSCFLHVQNEANKIKKEARELDQLINRKLKDYEDLREDMKGKELEVQNLLEKGKTEQQVSSTCM